MKTKFQVFISSTYEDLRDARERVIRCVLEMGHIPVGMEMFSAANEEQWRIIQRQIDDCDYYVVIVAFRYGSMDKGISYTEKEYDYAAEQNIPILGFVIDQNARRPKKTVDTDPLVIAKLESFKQKVKSRMISIWKNPDDLYAKTAVALSKAFTAYDRPGYIRGDQIADTDVYSELARLSSENAALRSELSTIEHSAAKKADEANEELVRVLEAAKRNITVRFKDKLHFDDFGSFSLLDIFETVSVYLLVEGGEQSLMTALAFAASGRNDFISPFPLPTNRFAEWMADLYVLDLVAVSPKVHAATDSEKYWTLTPRGRDLMNNIRKLRLLSNLPPVSSRMKPDDQHSILQNEHGNST